MRTSFILHLDSLDILDELSNEEAGILLRAMRDFNREEEPTLSGLMKVVFLPFKNQFIRDEVKWDGTKEERSKAGRMGNLKRYTPDLYQQVTDNQITLEEAEEVAKSRKCEVSDNLPSQNVADGRLNKSVSVSDSKKGSKKDKEFVPPSLSDVIEYFKDNDYTSESAETAFNYYNVRGWKDSKGKKVSNWKLKMQNVWFKDENKEKQKVLWVKVRLSNTVQDFIKSNYEQAVIENKLNCDNPEIIKEYYK